MRSIRSSTATRNHGRSTRTASAAVLNCATRTRIMPFRKAGRRVTNRRARNGKPTATRRRPALPSTRPPSRRRAPQRSMNSAWASSRKARCSWTMSRSAKSRRRPPSNSFRMARSRIPSARSGACSAITRRQRSRMPAEIRHSTCVPRARFSICTICSRRPSRMAQRSSRSSITGNIRFHSAPNGCAAAHGCTRNSITTKFPNPSCSTCPPPAARPGPATRSTRRTPAPPSRCRSTPRPSRKPASPSRSPRPSATPMASHPPGSSTASMERPPSASSRSWLRRMDSTAPPFQPRQPVPLSISTVKPRTQRPPRRRPHGRRMAASPGPSSR